MYKNYDDLPSVLSVKELKDFLGISRAGAYQLLHREDFPTLHVASRLLVAKDKLLAWMEQNTDTVIGLQ
jgi:predicted DNA-binding transcriptional regulator AlpA